MTEPQRTPGALRRSGALSASVARELVEALVIAVVFALFVRTFLFQAFRIPSSSMERNLLIGDHILVNKLIFAPVAAPAERRFLPERTIRRGDVVVFRFPQDPTRDFIKRCLGLPGDRVELRRKELWLNGRRVAESGYIHFEEDLAIRAPGYHPPPQAGRDDFGPLVVPPGEYFCLGDNRDVSNDSRSWGTVPIRFVKGRALLIYWSSGRAAESPEEAEGTGLGGWEWLVSAARWERSFRLVR